MATDVGNDKSQNRQFKGTFDCLKKTLSREGVRGIYAGMGVSLTGVVIFKALYMGGYDSVKSLFDLQHSSVPLRLFAAQVRYTQILPPLCLISRV